MTARLRHNCNSPVIYRLRIHPSYHRGEIPAEERERALDQNLQRVSKDKFSRIQISDITSYCEGKIENPFDQIMAAHFRCILALRNRNWVSGFDEQLTLVNGMVELWKEETSWILPILFQVCLDLRLCAEGADQELVAAGKVLLLKRTPRQPFLFQRLVGCW